MVQVSYPGVYIQEVPSGVNTIRGVSTSITAFFGRTDKGLVNKPIRCQSWGDFEREFGGSPEGSDLAAYVRQFFNNGGSDCYVTRIANGGTGNLTFADFRGSVANHTGFYALDQVDIFNLMVIPRDIEITNGGFIADIYDAASNYCKQNRAFLLMDSPKDWTINNLPVSDIDNKIGNLRGRVIKDYSAVFYPDVQYTADNGSKRFTGPAGMIAGLIARIDSTRGVWKAPAGTEATLNGVSDLDVKLSDLKNGQLNKQGVNCIRDFKVGFVNWGARTMDGSDDFGSEWKYIQIRRTALFIEESLYRGTKVYVFQPNDEPLWAQIRLNVGAFMLDLFKKRAFQGSSPSQAFFVKCDAETTTQSDRNKGIVNIMVGFAPLKPAEFVVIKIQQMVGDLGG